MVGGTLTIANDCVTTVSGDGSVTTKPLENFVSGLNFRERESLFFSLYFGSWKVSTPKLNHHQAYYLLVLLLLGVFIDQFLLFCVLVSQQVYNQAYNLAGRTAKGASSIFFAAIHMFIRVEHVSRSEHLNKFLDLGYGYPWVGMLNNMGKHFYSFKNLSFLCLVAFILTKSPVNPSYEWLQPLPMQQPDVELKLVSECITES
jgi:hypothetical protein